MHPQDGRQKTEDRRQKTDVGLGLNRPLSAFVQLKDLQNGRPPGAKDLSWARITTAPPW